MQMNQVPVYQRSTGKQISNPQEVQSKTEIDYLKYINFELAELYFPIFVLQINFDVFPLRNRKHGNQYKMQQNNQQQ